MMILGLILCVMLLAAAVAMTLRNLIHSALLLTLNWVGLAAVYLWAGAEFVAFAQVLVYVGAVSMVVLFAVLLTRHRRDETTGVSSAAIGRAVAGGVTAAVVAGVLCGAVMSTDLSIDASRTETPILKVKQVGEQLMGPQAASLLVVGVLLTVALIGAVIIAAPEKTEGGE